MTPDQHALWTRLFGRASALLKVRRSEIFFDHEQAPPSASLVEAVRELPPAPRRIGEYEVLERLGADAVASVYRARQTEPDRIVAIKLLHPWLISDEAREHFRLEAQALASLKHRSIPPVFTIGEHEGAVYFAMELVTGPSLLDWARATRPSLERCLAMLATICQAIHHAHLRGFVHRALEPEVIRVGEDGTPQVLDFGITGSLEPTTHGPYSSPEQLEPGAPIDLRADVFSLGRIAFELLTGQRPELVKGQPLPRLATLAPRLGAQLDHLLARALELTPERRYASAGELGADLSRLLAHEPVAAYPGGWLYRAGLLVRRNRLATATITAMTLALGAGAIISRAQSAAAEQARAEAATEAGRAKASLDFLNRVLQPDVGEPSGRAGTIGAALDRAAAKLPSAQLDPHVEAAVRASLANTYLGIGEWKNAALQAREALAAYTSHQLDDDEDLAEIDRVVTQVYEEVGDTAAAVDAADRALAIEERFHGQTPHTHLTNSLHVAAIAHRDAGRLAEALVLHRRAIELEREHARAISDTDDLSDMLDQLGTTLSYQGAFEEAERLQREALELNLARYGPEHQRVANTTHHLASIAFERGGHLEEARALLERSTALRLKILGKDHVRLAYAHSLMARIELARGHVQAAAQEEAETLRIAERSYGAHFGSYARLSGPQVLIELAQGKTAEALALSQRLLEATSERYGPHHHVTAEAASNHGLALLENGQTEAAITELTEALADLTRVLGERPLASREARERLARALAAQTSKE